MAFIVGVVGPINVWFIWEKPRRKRIGIAAKIEESSAAIYVLGPHYSIVNHTGHLDNMDTKGKIVCIERPCVSDGRIGYVWWLRAGVEDDVSVSTVSNLNCLAFVKINAVINSSNITKRRFALGNS